MVLRSLHLIIALLLLSSLHSYAAAGKDPGYLPITDRELVRLIRSTPIESATHSTLISRANNEHLLKVAYEQYTLLWKRNPRSAYSNLRLGVAAEAYAWHGSYTSPQKFDRFKPDSLYARLIKTARSCLSQAVNLEPDLAAANTAYGRFLAKHTLTSNTRPALRYLKKGVSLAPERSASHAALGEALINPYHNIHNPEEAERALLTAVRLDTSYAYPHYVLIRLYSQQKRWKEAQRALQSYARLVPPSAAASAIKYWKPDIDQGLRKQ